MSRRFIAWCEIYDKPLSDVTESESYSCEQHGCVCESCSYIVEAISDDEV